MCVLYIMMYVQIHGIPLRHLKKTTSAPSARLTLSPSQVARPRPDETPVRLGSWCAGALNWHLWPNPGIASGEFAEQLDR